MLFVMFDLVPSLITFIGIFFTSMVRGQQCFYPNGNPVVAEGAAPCLAHGESFCCPLNWACLSNKLCYLDNNGSPLTGRYSCTDSTWNSTSCPGFCQSENGSAGGNQAVLQCSNGRWCCSGNRSFNCCEKDDTVFFNLPAGKPITSINTIPLLPTAVATSSRHISSIITAAIPFSSVLSSSSTQLPTLLPSPTASETINEPNSQITSNTENETFPIATETPHQSRSHRISLITGLTFGVIAALALILTAYAIRRQLLKRKNQHKNAFLTKSVHSPGASNSHPPTDNAPSPVKNRWSVLNFNKTPPNNKPDQKPKQTPPPCLSPEEMTTIPGHVELAHQVKYEQPLTPVSLLSSGNQNNYRETMNRPISQISQQVPQYIAYSVARNSTCSDRETRELDVARNSQTVRAVFELPGDIPEHSELPADEKQK